MDAFMRMPTMSQVPALPPDATPTVLLDELQIQVKRQQLLDTMALVAGGVINEP